MEDKILGKGLTLMLRMGGDRYRLVALFLCRFGQFALIGNDFRLIAGPAEV